MAITYTNKGSATTTAISKAPKEVKDFGIFAIKKVFLLLELGNSKIDTNTLLEKHLKLLILVKFL